MTGWAQVNGLRGDTSIEKRVEYDIWYIENWSLGLDIRILLKTAFGGMINNEGQGLLKGEPGDSQRDRRVSHRCPASFPERWYTEPEIA